VDCENMTDRINKACGPGTATYYHAGASRAVPTPHGCRQLGEAGQSLGAAHTLPSTLITTRCCATQALRTP